MISKSNIAVAGMLLAAGFFSPAAKANLLLPGQIVLYQGSPSSVDYSYSVGGEFTALTAPSLYSSYAPSAEATVTVGGNTYTGFQTFCVQTGVDFTPGTIYNYSTSLASIGSPDAFALTEGTAWLYSQFAKGTLANYDYANTGTGTSTSSPGLLATRTTDAGALQAAIWTLQDNQSYSGYPAGGLGNLYYDEALAAIGLGNLETAVTGSTDYGVEVLNISTAGGAAHQNQLVYTGAGVPDGGSTMALFTGCMAALGIFGIKARRSLEIPCAGNNK